MSPVVKIAGFTAMLVAIFALGLLEDHANHCIIGGEDSKADERTSELMGAVKRLLRHGQPRAFIGCLGLRRSRRDSPSQQIRLLMDVLRSDRSPAWNLRIDRQRRRAIGIGAQRQPRMQRRAVARQPCRVLGHLEAAVVSLAQAPTETTHDLTRDPPRRPPFERKRQRGVQPCHHAWTLATEVREAVLDKPPGGM